MSDYESNKNDSARDLLMRIDERVLDLHRLVKGNGTPGLCDRVDSLEADRDKIRGLAHVAGGGGILGTVVSVWHIVTHYVSGK